MIREQVTYTTTDDIQFLNKEAAEEHEDKIREASPLWKLLIQEKNSWFSFDDDGDGWSVEIYDWIMKNKKAIKELL